MSGAGGEPTTGMAGKAPMGTAGTAPVGTAGAPVTGMGGAQPGGVEPPTCTTPQLDEVSGLTSCAEGYRYRGSAVTCSSRAGAPEESQGGAGGMGAAGAGGAEPTSPPGPTCNQSCEGEHAFCGVLGATPYTTACQLGCLSDDECSEFQLCLCGPSGGVCMQATCRSDADCTEGYHCAQEDDVCFVNRGLFSCQRPEDECLTGEDCNFSKCMSFGSDHRTCLGAVCGRPFLVEAQVRVAPIVESSDWLVAPCLEALLEGAVA